MDAKITLPQLAKIVAQKKNMTQKDAEAFLRTFFDVIIQNVTTEKQVKIKGLGTFKLIEVLDRESVNVSTGERIVIPGHSKLSFMPDASLKDMVNKPFADFQTVVINEGTSLEEMERIPDEKEEMEQEPEVAQEQYQEEVQEQVQEEEQEQVQEEEQNLEQKEEQVPCISQVAEPVPPAPAISEEPPAPAQKEVPPTPVVSTSSQPLNAVEKWAIALGIILLCLLSYFIGYSHLLSPSEDAPQKTELKKNTKSVTPAPKEVTPAPAPEQSEAPASEPAPQKVDVQYDQVPDGEYEIIGTRKTYIMKSGDYLTRIALKEYGDKEFTRYIITHNRFRDPNNVPVGAEIKLPELKKKQ